MSPPRRFTPPRRPSPSRQRARQQENGLGFVHAGREIRRTPVIGMKFLHERAMRSKSRRHASQSFPKPEDLDTPAVLGQARTASPAPSAIAPAHRSAPDLPHASRQTGGPCKPLGASPLRGRHPGNHDRAARNPSASGYRGNVHPADRRRSCRPSHRRHDRAPSRSRAERTLERPLDDAALKGCHALNIAGIRAMPASQPATPNPKTPRSTRPRNRSTSETMPTAPPAPERTMRATSRGGAWAKNRAP